MSVRIYQPTRTAMQSGRGKTEAWIAEFETATPRRPDPLMGWTSAGDTLNQVRLRFPTEAEAIAFAERKGWDYTVQRPQLRKIRPQNYADNFRPKAP